ncbi:hypothetical protein N9A62_00585, partial [Akkermansiaceae bacterium]|nr:hypothetical protein [Akkermansiaceae bacterium]
RKQPLQRRKSAPIMISPNRNKIVANKRIHEVFRRSMLAYQCAKSAPPKPTIKHRKPSPLLGLSHLLLQLLADKSRKNSTCICFESANYLANSSG